MNRDKKIVHQDILNAQTTVYNEKTQNTKYKKV
jgi:hypothetical protein